MAAAQKDAVDHPLHAHLALVLLLQDNALLHHPPSRDPVLESDATQHEDMFDLQCGQLPQVLLSDRSNREHLQDELSAYGTLCQLLSTLVAGDQVAAVEDDTVNVCVHAHLALQRLVIISDVVVLLKAPWIQSCLSSSISSSWCEFSLISTPDISRTSFICLLLNFRRSSSVLISAR